MENPEYRFGRRSSLILFLSLAVLILFIVALIVVSGERGVFSLSGSTPKDQNIVRGAAIDVLNWNVYENRRYGYSIKYPADWVIVANSFVVPREEVSSIAFNEGVEFLENGSTPYIPDGSNGRPVGMDHQIRVSLFSIENSTGSTLRDWYIENAKRDLSYGAEVDLKDLEETTWNGRQALKIGWKKGAGGTILVANGSSILSMTLAFEKYSDTEFPVSPEAVFSAMLDSLVFHEESLASYTKSWTTYTDKSGEISFRYPPSYAIDPRPLDPKSALIAVFDDFNHEYASGGVMSKGGTSMSVAGEYTSQPLDEIVDEYTKGVEVHSREKVVIDGRRGVRLAYRASYTDDFAIDHVVYFISVLRNGTFYTYNIMFASYDAPEATPKDIEAIMTTFSL